MTKKHQLLPLCDTNWCLTESQEAAILKDAVKTRMHLLFSSVMVSYYRQSDQRVASFMHNTSTWSTFTNFLL